LTSRVAEMCLYGINWSAVKNDYTSSWTAWPWSKWHNDVPKRQLTIHKSTRRNITYMLDLNQHSLRSSNFATTIDVATISHGRRSSIFWDVMQRWVVVTRVSGLPIGPDRTTRRWDRCCPATSVANCQSTLRNIPEEQILYIRRKQSPKSCTAVVCCDWGNSRQSSE